MNIGLTGDVNGDFQVTRADLKSIRSILGRTSNSRFYVAADDTDTNNRIGTHDLELASRNLGDSTSLRPLTVSLAPELLAPESHLVRVAARSQPGILVTFLQPGFQGVIRMADAGGQADSPPSCPSGPQRSRPSRTISSASSSQRPRLSSGPP